MNRSDSIHLPKGEILGKILILVVILPVTGRGIGNMSALGCFNFAALVLAFFSPSRAFTTIDRQRFASLIIMGISLTTT